MRVKKLNNFKKVMLGAAMAAVMSMGTIGVSAGTDSDNIDYNLKYKVTASANQCYSYLERTGETSRPIKTRAYGFFMKGTKPKNDYKESGEAYRGVGITFTPPRNYKLYQGGGKFYFGGELVKVNGEPMAYVSVQ